MSHITEKLQSYAELLLRKGVNLQPGQRLFVRKAPIEQPEFMRILAETAYRIGARHVEVFWADDRITRTRFELAPLESFSEYPQYQTDALVDGAKRGDAFIAITGANPSLLDGIESRKVSDAVRAENHAMSEFRSYSMRNAINWLVAAVPTTGWAGTVFPELSPHEAVERLWHEIFRLCRLDLDDPIEAWEHHAEEIARRTRYLNEKQYRSLQYRADGTDLTVGLPEGHAWHGVSSRTPSGVTFIPNMPTEEVFTLPHCKQVHGTVTATRPLAISGRTIDGFRLRFENGRAVEVSAEVGEETLRETIETDPGAARLGEVALVPHSSPISRSGLLFHNTLFDENASCHLALGRAYRFCLADGEELSGDEFSARGGNSSMVHYDFMIGSSEMDIDGVTSDGTREPLFRAGEWAF